ncbi:phosphoribosyltransferase [Streptomyces sp. JJ66]|uniref:phosphoribosyltransferase n=1 Tax=Streptomyces sp. JJ66 TaxID=2803843 RepID=UPI001C574065|nr:phosphoribosyltransferase family protein [Streptomyces sp. JJ66]MBW1604528.1 phosphoribosyltransferase [Streptomyces sp. JJ66]
MRFANRREAGRQLADRLHEHLREAAGPGLGEGARRDEGAGRGRRPGLGDGTEPSGGHSPGHGPAPGVLVLALPRGGVPVAAEIAERVSAPLDVFVARKIGAPGQPELAIGALAGEDPPVFDPRALEFLGVSEDRMAPDVARERTELHRREDRYRGDRPAPELAGRTVLLVDDGLATGLTATAAVRALRHHRPAAVVLAVPVASRQAVEALEREADEVVALATPWDFGSVGQWYDDFAQLTDDDVVTLLNTSTRRTRSP